MNDAAADPKRPEYVVGVGASAGGLEALVSFFSSLPSDSGMAFVVIQHLSPDHKSLMVELLAKHTTMPVQHAEDGTPVEANNVYLIPPSKNITIYHGSLFLADQDRSLGHINFPIDLFFDSLAEDQGEKAIAVVLSGTGSDGTRGIGVVKDKGGLILVQDPETAQYSGMPRSAIRSGHVDRVLPPEALPETLLDFAEAPLQERETWQLPQTSDESAFAKVRSLIRHEFDVDFSAYKPSTFIRRIKHRMNIHQLGQVGEYAERLRNSPRELQMLYRDLLIGVTRFFRDEEAFSILEQQVIPRIVDTATSRQVPAIRVWVAGCSTGEEAYSIAMLFHEYLQGVEKEIDLKIFATDIDQEAISRAASGAYPDSAIAELSPERRRAFFVKIGSQYQITRQLRGSVIFAPHNLIKDPPFSKLDLISCRNLLIYLKPEAQEQVLDNFNYALREQGFLFLGSSESITGSGLGFTAVSAKHRIYQQQRSAFSRPRPAANMSAYRRGKVEPRPEHSPSVKAPKLVDGLFTDLLDEYVPAAVLVDANHQVLHVYGDVNRYMSVPAGEAKMNLLSMVHPSIKMLAGTALHKAKKEAGQVIYPEVALEDEDPDKSRRFNLIVDIEETPHGEDIFLIVFDDVSTDSDAPYEETARTYDLDRAAEERIEDLERKLNYTEENLQATVEELETSNEELQATNEELMAANEELQSTNEELHSVNEELVTVNAELQEKLRQLTELNSDMNNLLQSTEVSTIFLDTELCIRKFTASAAKYVNLLSSDEGRPIHHFAHVFDDIDLHACAQDVLEDGTPIEQETKSDNDRWYRFRALPYLTEDEIVKGVVLTFVDITESKALRGALAAEKQRRRALEAALEVDGIDEAENNGRIDTPSSPPSTPPPTDPEDS